VDDIADYTADVAMAFGVIERAELGGSLVQARVGRYSRLLVFILILPSTKSCFRRRRSLVGGMTD
jgi:hypothetical protein